jgi:hypothetical protein
MWESGFEKTREIRNRKISVRMTDKDYELLKSLPGSTSALIRSLIRGYHVYLQYRTMPHPGMLMFDFAEYILKRDYPLGDEGEAKEVTIEDLFKSSESRGQ